MTRLIHHYFLERKKNIETECLTRQFFIHRNLSIDQK
jgi:hypothetical protein